MAALAQIYLKLRDLETIVNTLKHKGVNGVSVEISINDESNQYGQNVTSYIAQSKEEREAKKKRFYVGNGNVYWTNDIIKTSTKEDTDFTVKSSQSFEGEDLPF